MLVNHLDTQLYTKLQQPQSYSGLIARPRLLSRLDGCLEVPLTLISAPAGFGKTTLVSQWLERVRQKNHSAARTAWLSLDAQDGEPVRFLSYFIAALQTIYPDACPQTAQLLKSQELPSEQSLLALLVNEIDALGAASQNDRAEHLVIVLDDFDAMQNEAANQLLELLIQFPPPRLHLILTCRRDPRLPLAQFNAQQKLLELRGRDLRLSRAEIQEFAQQNFRDGGAGLDIEILEQRSEGWFAMLRLMALALRDYAGADVLAQLPDGHQDIARFFVEQVLARQSPELRACLVKVSILERFTAELCEQVCEMPPGGGAEFLNRLKAENLFLLSLDNQGVWFCFHQLFRQLLQAQFKTQYSRPEQADLHRRAGVWFRENNVPEQSIHHALAAGETADAVAVMAQYRHELMNAAQWNRLAALLRMYPAQTVAQSPDLLLTEAWLAHTFRHDFSTVKRSVQEALTRMSKLKLSQKRRRELRAECDVLTAMRLLVRESDAPGAIRLTQRAVQALPRTSYHVRSIAWIVLASGYQIEGESEQAHRVLAEACTEDIDAASPQRASVFGAACFVYWMDSDLAALEERARQTLYISHTAALHETRAWANYFLACTQYEKNNVAEAARSARLVFHESSPAGLAPLVNAAFILAACHQAQNQPDAARQTLDELEHILLERRSAIFLGVLGAFRAELAVRQGNLDAAAHWYETQARLLPQSPSMHLFYAPQLTAAHVLLAMNSHASRAQAASVLEGLLALVRKNHNTHFLIPVLAMQAWLFNAQGKRTAALEALTEAVRLGERSGAQRSFLDLGPQLTLLLKQLAGQGIAETYLDTLVRKDAAAHKARVLVTPDTVVTELTDREYEVLILLAERLSNKEIATKLFISPLTVKVHADHIYQKLNVNSRREAVQAAAVAGILKNNDALSRA